jgi:hypothetical protein
MHFLEKGHDAWSCDLLLAERNSNRHIQCNGRDILDDGWTSSSSLTRPVRAFAIAASGGFTKRRPARP